ncbi:MAG: DUF6263 family protein [Planctomycetota bacterium]
MLRNLVIVAVAVSLVVSAAGADEKIELKRRHVPGTYVIKQVTDLQSVTEFRQPAATQPASQPASQPAPLQTMTQNVSMLMVSEMSVGEPDESGQKLKMVFKRIRQSIKAGPMSMFFDSDSPTEQQNPMLAPIYNALIGAEIEVTLDPDGKPVAITGLEDLFDSLAKTNPALGPMLDNIKKQFGDQMIKQLFSMGENFLPHKAVAKGDTWVAESTEEYPMIGEVKITHNCKLKDIEQTPAGKTAIIEFAGSITGEEGATRDVGPTTKPFKMTFKKTEIRQSGTSRMNVETAMLARTEMDLDSAMVIIAIREDGREMEMAIKQEGNVLMTIAPGEYKPTATTSPTTRPASSSE